MSAVVAMWRWRVVTAGRTHRHHTVNYHKRRKMNNQADLNQLEVCLLLKWRTLYIKVKGGSSTFRFKVVRVNCVGPSQWRHSHKTHLGRYTNQVIRTLIVLNSWYWWLLLTIVISTVQRSFWLWANGKGMPDKKDFVNIHINLLSLLNIDII